MCPLDAHADRLRRPRRNAVLGLLLLLPILVFVAARFDEYPVGANLDDAIYVAMARSLAAGQGPVLVPDPRQPAIRPDVFPPGLPLLLAPVARLAPASLQALKAVPLLAALALLALVAALPAEATRRQRLLLVLLVGWNPWLVAYGVRVASETPYALASLGALLLYRRWSAASRSSAALLWGVAALVALAVMIRTVGLALLFALLGHLLLHRRGKRAIGLVIATTAALIPFLLLDPLGVEGLFLAGYRTQVLSHHADLAGRAAFMAANLAGYIRELPALLLPLVGNPTAHLAARASLGGVYPHLVAALGLALAGLIALGVGRALVRRRAGGDALALYLAIYGLGLLNFAGYPAPVQLRLLLPVLPLLYLFLIDGAVAATEAVAARRAMPAHARTTSRTGSAALVLAAVVLPMCLAHNVYRAARPLRATVEASGRGLVDPAAGAAWVRANTRPDDVVLVQDVLPRHIHFRRPVVGWGEQARVPQRAAVASLIDAFGVRYVFVGPSISHLPRQLDDSGAAWLAWLRSEPALFSPVLADTLENVFVFAVNAARPDTP